MKPWRSSFVTRWAVLFASMIIGVVLFSGWLRDRASREYFLEDQHRNLLHRLEVMRDRVQTGIDAVRKDILYLSSAPAFARLAVARNEAEREAALREVSLHFMGGLKVRPTYFQARLIGVDDGGREMTRFDQQRGQILEVPREQLERSADREYFVETVRLPAGRFYLSEISLNRESGLLSEPHTPALRAATPVFTLSGKLFGIVMVGVDVSSFFEELRGLAGPEVNVTLSNSQGDYLMHPNRDKCFGFDTGERHTIFDDHPQLRDGNRQARFEDKDGELSITDEFPFTWDSDKKLIMRLSLAKGPLLAPLQARRVQNFLVTLMLALIAGAVVMGVTHLFARGLRQVAEAVERYQPGQPLLDLPPDSPDEVGLLTRKFRDMSAKISEQMQGLRNERQRAETAMRAREEFFATISHEIRTPMNAVLGMAHLLETEGQGPHQAERLRTLKFAGRHLMALLNNLLDRERIESGDIVFDRLDFDLQDLMGNLHRGLEPLASRKGLVFVLETKPGIIERVQGDPVRLYQVLNNLVHNAIKFTESGRIILQVEPSGQDTVNFRISDTGPGLPAAVFEMVRVNSAAPATAGLGLRISQRLIQLLGGKLEVESTSAGTIFSFSLELPAARCVAAHRAPEQPPDLNGYSALVVEDVPSNQMVLGALLGKTGMTVDFAASAAQAREKLTSGNYDIAFVDIQLPDASGADLASVLLRMQPGLRLLAVTAQVSQAIRAECEKAGVRAFVPKPIEPAELYEKLRRLTEPQIELVKQMFDYEEAKVADYLAQLEIEFRNWETEVRAATETTDSERLRRLHHKMKNACGQLGLWKLDNTLGELREAIETGAFEKLRSISARALRLITTARQLTGVNRFSRSSR